MAIRLADVYANSNAANSDYPGGSFKNATSASGSDGTPLDQAWANDMLGFFQALLRNAGVTANGTPDTAQASQYYDAMQSLMWAPGDLKFCMYALPGTRWLEANGTFIGGPLAANIPGVLRTDDVLALYNVLWPITDQLLDNNGNNAPRGASAAVDFAAGKSIKLPDMRGCVPRGWDHGRGFDPGRTLGSYQADAQQNITGEFGIDDRSNVFTPTGAFSYTYPAGSTGSDGTGSGGKIVLDASRQIRTANEVRMKNIAGVWVIRY